MPLNSVKGATCIHHLLHTKWPSRSAVRIFGADPSNHFRQHWFGFGRFLVGIYEERGPMTPKACLQRTPGTTQSGQRLQGSDKIASEEHRLNFLWNHLQD